MSTGVLIYCFNTEKLSYHRAANFCISQLRKHLCLPVTVVTNNSTMGHIKRADSVIAVENRAGNKRVYNNEAVDWFNLERSHAYDHTPYDTTFLMDADYFVYTNNLLQLADTDYDFLLHDRVHDLTSRHPYVYDNKSMIPLVWATVTIFKKNAAAKTIFDLIKHIQQHYHHYCRLFRIDFRNFRNDYAFAIAMRLLNIKNFIPTPMATLGIDCEILEINNNGIKFKYTDSNSEATVGIIQQQDVHVMQKEIPVNV